MNKFQKLCALYKQEGFSRSFFSGIFAGAHRIAKRTVENFRRRLSGIPSPSDIAANGVYWSNPHVPHGEKVLYLTFDVEWKKPENLGKVLDALKDRHITATFFLVGRGVRENADYVRRIRAEGHAVGNHTMTHSVLTKRLPGRIQRELSRCAQCYRSLTGEVMPNIMRPPCGRIDRSLIERLHKLGYKTVLWNMHVTDWNRERPATWEVFRAYLETDLKNGAIILQHTYSDETAAHIGKYLDYCLAKGYRFDTLEEFL